VPGRDTVALHERPPLERNLTDRRRNVQLIIRADNLTSFSYFSHEK
ncbi:MAG: hypothetical protein RI928_1680, partial [Pseudomonadota bacterium]